jgi:hypothetical protein
MKSSGRLPHQAADKGSKEKRHLPGAIVQSEDGTSGKAADSAIRDPRRLFAARNGDGVKDSSGRSDLDADDGRRPAVCAAGQSRCWRQAPSVNARSTARCRTVPTRIPATGASRRVPGSALYSFTGCGCCRGQGRPGPRLAIPAPSARPRLLPAPSCFAEVALNVGDFRQAAARLTILGAPGHGLRPPASWPLPLGPQVVMRCLAY